MNWKQTLLPSLCAASLAVGCAHHKPDGRRAAPVGPKPAAPVVSPDFRPIGNVATVNTQGRFIVVSFNSAMPALGQQLGVYHGGAKVAEVKITGPQRENNVVADIVTGEPHEQDEVRPD